MIAKCLVCGTKIRLTQDQNKSLSKGYSISLYCSNSKCINSLGGLCGPKKVKNGKKTA